MKTNMIKTAAFTLAMVISISVNAQNTKSLKENRITKKLESIVKENLADFTNTFNNLKASVMYKPETDVNFAAESNIETMIDLTELESVVKYVPNTNMASSPAMENKSEFENIYVELKEIVKYKPQSESSEIESELKKVTEELATVVRYTPAS